ncbi:MULTISPECIES: peptidylprolyl isomerase [Rhodobacterales]|uniref:peptidylprolyl isomerase n=1 Tax=Roseobacter sp. N2S TaxID=2663844 RepID=UPI00285B8E84|nr:MULTISPECIES: peptidylprolyl isomerase [Rhodobacterales]MDR6265434.1 cyclophilin family peptidyl-prolyl cis-trans isomerase [Roseobacter sp. N2S]
MRLFTTLLAAATIAAAPLFAADAENTLVIEVAGENSGIVEIELLPDVAPRHVERIKRLTRDGLYNDVVFHRVIPDFMAQTGDVEHGRREGFNLRYAGIGGSAFPDLPAEFSDIEYETGVVGMARSQDPDSANSQFFIMFAPAPFLNGQYTVVGRVLSGQDVVDSIKKGDQAANGAVAEPDYMKTVQIKSDIK